jgi:hypothetical protein
VRSVLRQLRGRHLRIEIPEHWNGELMLSAHGFVSNAGAQEVGCASASPRSVSISSTRGSPRAASSYRCNGYVPGMGLQDTMALTDLFTRFNGGTAPRAYPETPMGGHVTLLGMHEFPTQFAGALAMCPAGPELFDYFTAVGAAAGGDHGRDIRGAHHGGSRHAPDAELLGEPPNYTDKDVSSRASRLS